MSEAPFMDRVVHHALHRKLEPLIDPLLSDSVFACRKGKGNRNAALALLSFLQTIGSERFAIKIDVSKYFNSIDHRVLKNSLIQVLPDSSINGITDSLLESDQKFSETKMGIPTGNLTSQLFANFYLKPVDEIALKALECPYYWKEKDQNSDTFYIRYMDDIVLVGRNKGKVLDAVDLTIGYAIDKLKLNIPIRKRMPLGKDPIPFLGYVLNHDGYKILSRNKRRYKNKIKLLEKKKKSPSSIAQVKTSFEAWSVLL